MEEVEIEDEYAGKIVENCGSWVGYKIRTLWEIYGIQFSLIAEIQTDYKRNCVRCPNCKEAGC